MDENVLATPTEDFEKGTPKILKETVTINGVTVTYGELFGDDEYDAKRFKSKVTLLMKTPKGEPADAFEPVEEEGDDE